MISTQLARLAAKLDRPLYVVGGYCRDELAGLRSARSDVDICAAIGAERFSAAAQKEGFRVTAVYGNTGTMRLTAEDGEIYEYACFRTDRYVRGEHNPHEVFFTDDILLDAKRRDFKCNAVYYDIAAEKYVDPLGGMDDIRNRVLTTVAPADKVFGEDGLRLLRLCRIAAQTGFSPDEECLEGAKRNAALIDDIAAERVWAELNLLLHSDLKYGISEGQYRGLKLMHAVGVLERILPELAAGDGMEQRADFHDHDVLEHSFRCVKYASPEVRLAALLHDVGKPFCLGATGRFVRHEEEGERIALKICDRLRVPKKTAVLTAELIRWHMYDVNCLAKESKVRRFIVAHNGILDRLLLLKQADYSACKDDLSIAPCVAKWKNVYAKMKAEGAPFSVKELNVRGDALIAAGVPKERTGEALFYLLGECALDARLNEREKLIKLALSRFCDR